MVDPQPTSEDAGSLDPVLARDTGIDRSAPSSPLANRRVLTAVAVFVVVWYLFAIILFGWHLADRKPNDFLAFWAAGQMAEQGDVNAVYDVERHHRATEELTGDREGDVLPFLYPPSFLFVARALALVGYFPAFFLFTMASAAVFAVTIWRLIPDRLAILLGFAVPTTIANLRIGQIGLVLAAAATTALADGHRHPWRAGLALGVLSMKPQIGLGVGLALLLARAWSAIGVGLMASVGLALASAMVFGSSVWLSFFQDALHVADVLMDFAQEETPFKGQALLSIAEVLGLSERLSWALHIVFAIAVIGYVGRAIHAEGLNGRTSAMALISTALIAPRSFVYDFAVVVPAGCLILLHSSYPPRTVRLGLAICIGLIGLALPGAPTTILAGVILLFLAGKPAPIRDLPQNGRACA